MNPILQIAAALALGLALGAAAAPEPEGYWTGPMHGVTPAGLAGASTVDAKALAALIAKERPLMVDVAAEEMKPAGMAPDALWSPIHRSVPGSIWMPGAGDGALGPAQEKAFTDRVAALTSNIRDRPVVAFCHRDCWASWNAAKRLVRHGYKRVYWFADGVEGWRDAYEAAPITQDPVWAARAK